MVELIFIGIILLVLYACRDIIHKFIEVILTIFFTIIGFIYRILGIVFALVLIVFPLFALVDTLLKNPQTVTSFIAQIPGAFWLLIAIVAIWLFIQIIARYSGTPSERFERERKEREQEEEDKRNRERARNKRIRELENLIIRTPDEEAELNDLKQSLWL